MTGSEPLGAHPAKHATETQISADFPIDAVRPLGDNIFNGMVGKIAAAGKQRRKKVCRGESGVDGRRFAAVGLEMVGSLSS